MARSDFLHINRVRFAGPSAGEFSALHESDA
jgi:hypothetical protein